jgi:nitrate/nitrite transporter NarK
MSLNRTQIVDWLYRCGDIFTKESDFLTGLDKEIGDADHGLNMHRGFSKVVEKLPSIADKDIGFILKNTGMTLLSNVGGASGFIHLIGSVSGIVGPIVTGYIVQSTGKFDSAFVLAGTIAALGALLVLFVIKTPRVTMKASQA